MYSLKKEKKKSSSVWRLSNWTKHTQQDPGRGWGGGCMDERTGLHVVSKIVVSFIQTATSGAGVSCLLYEMRTLGIGGLK